ncbi:hypothetical protein RvY_00790 [Ramazzottius varieornatus]|uniref:Peptidase M20 dimerisation domain-containing protein n=1 Tax=Ramazzottius varieornatus TaxID=947166 RepID=A0A1D1UL70_RAMVA|nr:hypothetical protein RvY_00790 [Ramazzottius varieornatus]
MKALSMAAFNDSSFPAGKVVVLGTPAEEGGGGKIDLINAGAFKDIDFAMMIHPHSDDVLYTVTLGLERCFVRFHGKASHPTVGPLEGISALDAAVAAYSNVSQARQHMMPEWRVHGILINGGTCADVVPEYTLSQYYVRCPKMRDLPIMKQQLNACFEAAAKSTGCRVEVEWMTRVFLPLDTNRAMANIFGKYSMQDGVIYGKDPGLIGSSDIGNVSVELPTIHPKVYIGQKTLIHTRDFQTLAGSPGAQYYILRAAKAMAMTCIDLIQNPQLRAEAKQEFEMTHNSNYC